MLRNVPRGARGTRSCRTLAENADGNSKNERVEKTDFPGSTPHRCFADVTHANPASFLYPFEAETIRPVASSRYRLSKIKISHTPVARA